MSQKRDNTTPSCAICQRRKVKCDRVYPCAACTKSGLECVFNEVTRKRPRKRNDALHNNATHDSAPHSYDRTPEAGLISHSATDLPSPASDHGSAPVGGARLIDGRYVNNHLYRDIVVDTDAVSSRFSLSDSTYEQSRSTGKEDWPRKDGGSTIKKEFPFEPSSLEMDCKQTHLKLPANHVIFLWQTYLNNVDPMMKVSHAPSVQMIMLGQIGRDSLPKNEEALTSAISFISVVSLRAEECQESLGASRVSLLQLFRNVTEVALSAAGFVTSTDPIVLQALILYLAGLRSIGEVQYAWSMMGLAIRIAGAIGLARDGSAFDLSSFDTEMRRRLWWALVYLDTRMSEVVGQDGDLMCSNFDARPPLNLNDVDLFPTMKHLPLSRLVPTESAYAYSRTLCLISMRELHNGSGIVGTWPRLQSGAISMREKQSIMENMERVFYDNIFKTYDPTVPLQYIAINAAKTFIAKVRLVARIPIVHVEREWESSDGYSDNAFLLSMEVVQHQLDLWCEPGVRQWNWHWQALFQWYALTCLLRQTRLRHPGPDTSKAWTLITRVFDVIIPTLELGQKKNLLFNGINALLSMAKKSRNKQHDDTVDQSFQDDSRARMQAKHEATSIPSYRSNLPQLSSGFGSRPHSAMLPGMSTSALTPASENFDPSIASADSDNSMLGLDLDAIDWVEFDRLAAELIQQ